MSPSINSVVSPDARATLTANCAATLVFPSRATALGHGHDSLLSQVLRRQQTGPQQLDAFLE